MSKQIEYINRIMVGMIQFYGSRCNNPLCQIHYNLEKLEFAHIKPTKLHSVGRGKKNRVLDIRNNKDKYTLLCHNCHKEFDKENTT